MTLERAGERPRYLGVVFSGVPVRPGDRFWRPSAGGGGLGDPLERDPTRVLEDVIDGYVTVAGAARDYGVVVEAIDAEVDEWRVDAAATEAARAQIRVARDGWLDLDANLVAEWLRQGVITIAEAVRRYGVICDWDSSTLLPRSTEQFRVTLRARREQP